MEIIELRQILEPLRKFTYEFERRSAKLTGLLPKIKQTYDNLIQFENTLQCDDSKKIFKFVLAAFIAKMNTLPMNTFKISFAISLEGRNKIRRLFPE